MTSSLKILQVSNRVPYPLNEGGTIGIYNYTRGFSEAGCDVTLFALSAKKHKINEAEANKELSKYARYVSFPIDTDVKVIPALLNLFSPKSYNVERFYLKEFEDALVAELTNNSYDVIQIEGTFPARYSETIFKFKKNAHVVLRQHNVEFQIWQRLASNCTNPLKKWYLNLLSKRLKNFEKFHLNQYSALVPVTEDDGELFRKLGCTIPIFPSPAGINTNIWSPSENDDNSLLYHIGSLEWMPNEEAVLWFIHDIWPKVLEQHPHLVFYVAGKGMSAEMKQQSFPNVNLAGEVASATQFVENKGITVVPLKSGSGIRLKILEAMSAGKIVISTTIGAQGISYTDQKDILIADNAQEFASAISTVLDDEDYANSIKQNARQLILDKYSNESVVRRLVNFYKDL